MSRTLKNPDVPNIITKKYVCKCCQYFTSSKKDFNKHLATPKHIKTEDATKCEDFSNNSHTKISQIMMFGCVNCDRQFKSKSGLWRHKKTCINKKDSDVSCTEIIEHTKPDKETELKDMIMVLVNENKEMRNIMMEQSKQITEIIPKLGNSTTNNNTINNNQKVSINVFLNEKCKDAINMSDFIKSIQVSVDQLQYTTNNGLGKGITKVIMDNMNKLSKYERPLHCSDLKRETIYIKDDDKWEKDTHKDKLKKAINKTSNKNYSALCDWTSENPGFMKQDDKQHFYAKTASMIGKPICDVEDKIIKSICKDNFIKE